MRSESGKLQEAPLRFFFFFQLIRKLVRMYAADVGSGTSFRALNATRTSLVRWCASVLVRCAECSGGKAECAKGNDSNPQVL